MAGGGVKSGQIPATMASPHARGIHCALEGGNRLSWSLPRQSLTASISGHSSATGTVHTSAPPESVIAPRQ